MWACWGVAGPGGARTLPLLGPGEAVGGGGP